MKPNPGAPTRPPSPQGDRVNEADFQPIRFISQSIAVNFNQPPALKKRPGCPESFTWRGQTFLISEKLKEWHDYGRRGRMAHNMRPAHLEAARRRGSWGVGRDYYRVRTACGRIFELYYDRAPRDADERGGAWFLFRELFDVGCPKSGSTPESGA